MKTYILLGYDPETGAASRPVGFLAVDDQRMATEFVPGVDAHVWREHIARCQEQHQTNNPSPAQVEALLDEANGITWGALVPDQVPDAKPDGAVATLMDEFLSQTP